MGDPEINRIWLQSYDRKISSTLEYENIPIFEYLDRAAEESPRSTAITFNNWKMSYSRLRKITERMAANLRSFGLQPGDRVAIMLPNTPQAIMSYWAVLKSGGTVVMVNPLYMEKELLHHFNDSGAKILITLNMLWPKIEKLLPGFNLERVFITHISDCLRMPQSLLYELQNKKNGQSPQLPYDHKNIIPWKKLLRKGEKFIKYTPDPREEIAALQYTGGTTGISKGVMLTHYNLAVNVQQCLEILHSVGGEKDTVLGLLPYFHIYGMTVCINFPTALMATLAPFPRFSPREVLKSIQKLRPTIFPSAPAIFSSLLQQKDIDKFDISSIKYCISGSAPIPGDSINRFRQLTGAEIIEGYGLTEASPITHLNPLEGVRKQGSIGLPFPDTDARIVDMEVGNIPLPPGKVGELTIRAPQVMKGYWNRPEETATSLRNYWLYTGDIGYMDEEGYFFIVDRKKDLIISGGYNIYPREIDEVLHEHPQIKEAITVGIPHRTRGESVKAFVVPEPGSELSRRNIISFCREKLANYKVPKKIEFREDLPKTMVGKILRRALREEEISQKNE